MQLYKSNHLSNALIPLPGSKSESNRALIINALCPSPGEINNLSAARDSQIMQDLLGSARSIYDAQDAGTVMRFMTAYLALRQQKAEITGSEHMKKRPIGILVDALRTLGAIINYSGNSGYPPLQIEPFQRQKSTALIINSSVSSQYISALLMMAPNLPQGLTLALEGKTVSTPYIEMTVSIMQHFGVAVDVSGQSYHIEPQTYKYSPFTVESDWSAASYWYAIFALSNLQELKLKGLKANSWQGDSIVAELMEPFGVKTQFEDNNAILSKTPPDLPAKIEFLKCPDLAQTFAVLTAALGHECVFTGLQTLKIKETDRIQALQTELQKLGANLIEENDQWLLQPIPAEKLSSIKQVKITTYDDHRMAMSFAALATQMDVEFDDTEVVNKSYPTFWRDLRTVGFKF
jgi:3-phosphoshikimate 1-carboxyvinyltransferase